MYILFVTLCMSGFILLPSFYKYSTDPSFSSLPRALGTQMPSDALWHMSNPPGLVVTASATPFWGRGLLSEATLYKPPSQHTHYFKSTCAWTRVCVCEDVNEAKRFRAGR